MSKFYKFIKVSALKFSWWRRAATFYIVQAVLKSAKINMLHYNRRYNVQYKMAHCQGAVHFENNTFLQWPGSLYCAENERKRFMSAKTQPTRLVTHVAVSPSV